MTGASDFPTHCALLNMTSVIFALINFDFFKQPFRLYKLPYANQFEFYEKKVLS